LGGTIASSSSSSDGGGGGGGRKWGMDPRKIRAWKDWMTGYPLVDANMRGKSTKDHFITVKGVPYFTLAG
jgi:hypothetical protein